MSRVHYFPFSPGIPWTLDRRKCVIPQIEQEIWQSRVVGQDAVILAHGGLLESFFSLSLASALTALEPSKKLYWAGRKAFASLARNQGLASYLDMPDVCKDYPVPLFMDAENRVYFNCLNNYIESKTYYGLKRGTNYDPLFKQIFKNAIIPWDERYVPVLYESNEFKQWCKANKFWVNKPYILVILENTNWSMHSGVNCLQWTYNDLKQFAALMNRFNLPVVFCSENIADPVYGKNIIKAPLALPIVIGLLMHNWMLLASEIDFHLLSLCISKATIISKNIKNKACNIYKNAEFIKAENQIFITNELTPHEAYLFCEALYEP